MEWWSQKIDLVWAKELETRSKQPLMRVIESNDSLNALNLSIS